MNPLRRIYLFVRDYVSEFGIAWSLARTHDCERAGGHRWGESKYSAPMKAFGSTCSRCKCWRSVAVQPPIIPTTNGTGSSMTITYNVTN